MHKGPYKHVHGQDVTLHSTQYTRSPATSFLIVACRTWTNLESFHFNVASPVGSLNRFGDGDLNNCSSKRVSAQTAIEEETLCDTDYRSPIMIMTRARSHLTQINRKSTQTPLSGGEKTTLWRQCLHRVTCRFNLELIAVVWSGATLANKLPIGPFNLIATCTFYYM